MGFATCKIVASNIALPLLLFASAGFAAGPPSGLEVLVVNPTASPVPVTLQGTGSVTGTVTVANNPMNVSVTNSSLNVSGTVAVTNPAGNPIPVAVTPGALTQLGQPASNLVTLVCESPPCTRMMPDGSTVPFSVPANQRLIVTDISWQGDSVGQGLLQTMVLSAGGSNGPFVWFGGALPDQLGIVSKSERLAAGIAFSVVPFASHAGGHVRFIRLYGYLVPTV